MKKFLLPAVLLCSLVFGVIQWYKFGHLMRFEYMKPFIVPAFVIMFGIIQWHMKKHQDLKFYKNLKKIYRKFVFITDILFDFIFSYAMLSEWYNRGMSSMPWFLLGLLFFITGIRKILNKPPIFAPLFKHTRTMLFNFVFSLALLTQWYDNGMFSMSILIGGLLFFSIGVIIGVRKLLKKPPLGELLKQLRTRYKS